MALAPKNIHETMKNSSSMALNSNYHPPATTHKNQLAITTHSQGRAYQNRDLKFDKRTTDA